MTIDYIVDYVMNTPTNTNKKVLTDLLESLGGTSPTGSIEIVENGEYEITNYAKANVNVPTGGQTRTVLYSGGPKEKSDYFNITFSDRDILSNDLVEFKIINLDIEDDYYSGPEIIHWIVEAHDGDIYISAGDTHLFHIFEWIECGGLGMTISRAFSSDTNPKNFSWDSIEIAIIDNN